MDERVRVIKRRRTNTILRLIMNKNTHITETSAPQPTPGTPASFNQEKYGQDSPSNLNSPVKNKTTNYFNNFFVPENTVSAAVNDSIVSFFEVQTGDKTAAIALAQAVINTALQQMLDPLKVLDDFKKLGQGELDAYLAMYLNLSRVNTSLLGIKNYPKANKYVARTILP